jgi:hypothetical protein
MDSPAVFLPQGYGTALAAIALYWLLLGLPGFVLLRRYLPAALECGGVGAVSISYLASFVVLSPVSIAAYVLHLPFWVFSVAVALVLALALAWCVRERAHFVLRRPSWIAVACSALIAADMLLGLRVGSNFGGDGRYHVARVRILLDLGFNNWDPLVPGHRFDAVYHTNLYHALIGASAQLTGIQAAAAWALCWFWAKLACAGALYRLSWAALGERWLAWISAAAFALWMASNSILAYPNMLSPYWLVPLALAFLVELRSSAQRTSAVIGLAAVAWVMPQVHSLYYVFVCLIVGLVIAPALLVRRMRKQSHRELTWALIALALGAPFLGVTFWKRSHASPPPAITRAHPAPADLQHLPWPTDLDSKRIASRDRGFIELGGGLVMLDPAQYLAPTSQQFQLLVLLAAGMAFGRRRRQMAVLAGAVAVVLAFVYVPPLCSLLARAAGALWIVRRLIGIPPAVHLALFPGALTLWLPAVLARERLHVVWLGAALAYAYLHGVDSKAWKRADYVRTALAEKPLYGVLRGHAMRRALCSRNIPSEALVATPLDEAGLSADCSAYPLALPVAEPSHGVRDMTQRRVDALVLLDPGSEAAKRLAILRYYHMRHLWVRGYANFLALRKAYKPWLVKVDQYHKDRVFTLDLKKSVSQRPRRSLR